MTDEPEPRSGVDDAETEVADDRGTFDERGDATDPSPASERADGDRNRGRGALWEDDEPATVLVVDDEQTVLDTFELALDSAGFAVRTARNGGEALVELDSAVDVVVLDRRMPGMSGDEILEHIRTWQSDCRVVIVTAVDPDVDVVDMAFDEYLVKPVGPAELVDTVEQILLFDRYERMFAEYLSLVRKHAALDDTFDDEEFRDSTVAASLEERRDECRAALAETVAAFDDEIADAVLGRTHEDLSDAAATD